MRIEYVSKDNAISACYDGFADCRDDCAENIRNIPAADVVEVVRCKDCIHRPHGSGVDAVTDDPDDDTCPYICSDRWYTQEPDANFFCAYGKKEEQN